MVKDINIYLKYKKGRKLTVVKAHCFCFETKQATLRPL